MHYSFFMFVGLPFAYYLARAQVYLVALGVPWGWRVGIDHMGRRLGPAVLVIAVFIFMGAMVPDTPNAERSFFAKVFSYAVIFGAFLGFTLGARGLALLLRDEIIARGRSVELADIWAPRWVAITFSLVGLLIIVDQIRG